MERIIIFIFTLTLVLSGCRPALKPLLLDSFEGKIDSSTVDFGSSDNSEIKVFASSDKKLCGEQSLEIAYRLEPGGYMWAARGWGLDVEGAACWLIKPADIQWQKYGAISLAMYGQESGAMYAFDLKDKGGQIWRYLIDDDFSGWKEIIISLDNFFSRTDWQPEEAEITETMDFPIKSYQFEPLLPGTREAYFDCLKLIAQ